MSETDYIPTRFNSKRGRYEPIHQRLQPRLASKGYPGWICKNSCGREFDENTKLKKCSECGAPLIRWLKYEQKS
jgi:hypothetical protein